MKKLFSFLTALLSLLAPAATAQVWVGSDATLFVGTGATLSVGGTLTNAGTLTNGGHVYLRGALANTGTLATTQGDWTLDGSSAQTLTSSAALAVRNLTFNSTAPGDAVTLAVPLTVGGTATFTDGILKTDATNLFILADGATATGASDASHAKGPVRKLGNAAFVFPLGNGTAYRPATTAPQSGAATDAFTAEYRETDGGNTASKAACLEAVSNLEHWRVERTAGSAPAVVGLAHQNVATVGFGTDALRVARYAGSAWEALACAAGGGQANGLVTTNGPTDGFGLFTLGKAGAASTIAVTYPTLGTLCAGATVNLTVTPSGTFNAGNAFAVQLSDATGSFASATSLGNVAPGSANVTIPTGTAAGGGYRLRVVSNDPAAVSNESDAFAVNAPPTATDPTDQVVTAGNQTAAVAFAGTATSYEWTNTNPAIGLGASGTGNIAAFTTLNPGTTPLVATITVTPKTPGCPDGPPQTFTITVNAAAVAPALAVAYPTLGTLCAGSSVSLTLTTTGTFNAGNAFTAQLSDATGSFANPTSLGTVVAGANSVTLSTNVVSGSGYRLRAVSTDPVVSGNESDAFTLNALPTVTDPTDLAVCAGAQTTAIAFSGTATSYTWTNDTPAIGLAASGTGTIAPFAATNPGTTPLVATITVTPTANGCAVQFQTFTLTVNPLPTVSLPPDQVVCAGGTFDAVVFAGTPGATFEWTAVAFGTDLGFPASGSGTIPALTTRSGGGATITVTPRLNGCAGTPQQFILAAYDLPVVQVTNRSVCAGATATAIDFLRSPNVRVNWTNDTPGIGLAASGTGQIPAFTAVNPGTTPLVATITVVGTDTISSCVSVPRTFTITVNVLPVVSISGLAATYCTNEAMALLVGSPAGGTFSGPGISANQFTASNAGPGSHTITYSYSTGTGCSASTTQSVTVNQAPTAFAVTGGGAYCTGGSGVAVGLSGSQAGVNYQLKNGNVNVGTAVAGTGSALDFGPQTAGGTYTVEASGGGCTTAMTGSAGVTLNALPVVSIGGLAATYCTNEAMALLVGSPAGGTFSGPGISANQFTASNAGPGSHTITYSYSTGTGCSASTTQSVTVNPTPTVNNPGDQVVCFGQQVPTVVFTGTGGATFDWISVPSKGLPIGLAASGTGNIPAFTPTNVGSAEVTVTPRLNGCAGTPQTFFIAVRALPVPSDTTDQIVCAGGQTAAIQLGSGQGVVVNWTNDTPSIGLPASGQSSSIEAFTALNPGTTPLAATITAVATDMGSGCVGPARTITITVNPTPTLIDPADQTVAAGSQTAAVAFAGPVAGTTYAWTNDTPTIGLAASGTGNIPAFAALNAGTTPLVATVTVTPTANGCVGPPQTFTITVGGGVVAPTLAATYPPLGTLCAGTAVSLTVTTTGSFNAGNAFTAQLSDATGSFANPISLGAVVAGSNSVTIPGGTAPGSGYRLRVVSSDPVATSNESTAFAVNPSPTMTDPADQTACAGSQTTAVVFSGTATTYEWTNSNPAIGLAASGTGDIPAFTPPNSDTTPLVATLTVTPKTPGCPDGPPQTFTITVNPIPTVAEPPSQTVCLGETTTEVVFVPAPPPGPKRLAAPDARASAETATGVTYAWTNDNPAIGLAASGTGDIPAFTPTNPGTTPLVALITVTPSLGGCSGTPQTFFIRVAAPITMLDPADLTVCAGSTTGAVVFDIRREQARVAAPNARLAEEKTLSFAWTNSNPAIGLAASGTGNLPVFTALNPGTTPLVATITVTPKVTGCTDGIPQTFTITVNPTPTLSDPADQTVCAGVQTAAVNFTATAGATFNWTNDAPTTGLAASGAGNIAAFMALNPGTTPLVATITATASLGGCISPAQTFTLTVNPTPTVADPADQIVCSGGPTAAVTFSGTATTYEWTNDTPAIGLAASGTGDIPAFFASNRGSSPLVATLTVTPKRAGCADGPAQTFTITVGVVPTVNDPADQVVTAGNAITTVSFTGAIARTTYAWSNSNPAIGLAASGTGDIPAFTATNTGTDPLVATITVTPSNSFCTGTPQSFTITVNPPVAGPAIAVTYPTLGARCAGSSVSLTVTPSGTFNAGNAFTAQLSDGSGGFASPTSLGAVVAGTNPVTIPAGTASGGGYKLRVVSSNPAVTSNESTAFAVNPLPLAFSLTGGGAYCAQGSGVAVGLSGSQVGLDYQLKRDGTDVGNALTGTGNALAFGNQTLAGTYTVVASYPISACSAPMTGSATVTVTPQPTANDPADQVVTAGSQTAAVTFGGTGTSYAWTNSNPAIGLAASGTGNIAAFTATNAGTTPLVATLTVTPTANGCPGPAQTFTITVNPAPTIAVTYPPLGELCAGAALSLTVTPGGTFNGGNAFTAQLSDASGSFAAPVSLGIVTAGNNQVVIPPGTASGLGYRLRVVSTSPAVASPPSEPFRVNALGQVAVALFPATPSRICLGQALPVTFSTTGSCPFPAGNVFTVQLSSATGSFANPTVLGTALPGTTTFPSLALNGLPPGTGYRVRILSSNPAQTSASSAPFELRSPSLSVTPGVGGVPQGGICRGNQVTVNFSLPAGSCDFPEGNLFTAQLSNATGSFTSPVSLGTVQAGVSNSLTIPATSAAGTGYRIRVVSSNPPLTSLNSIPFRVNACPSRMSAGEAGLVVAPNPATGGEIRCQVNGLENPRFSLTTQGGIALTTWVKAGEIPGTYVLTPNQALPVGVYLLRVSEGSLRFSQRILVVE